MSAKSDIEWTDATYNPIRARYWEIQSDGSGKERIGWHCEHASEGCRFCYAEGFNHRLGTGMEFKPGNLYREERKGYSNGEVKVFLDETMLLAPLRWKKPRMIFVCSMTDLFADFVLDEWIDKLVAVMAMCPQHTFQVLTKRSARMHAYMTTPDRKKIIAEQAMGISDLLAIETDYRARIKLDHFSACFAGSGPFPNIWLGVSTEDQKNADERIPHLLQTPAAVRFVSAEPLLGEIDLTGISTHPHCDNWIDAVSGWRYVEGHKSDRLPALDWVIVGGESGRKARPMHPEWARFLRNQCLGEVAFFFKQWGSWKPHRVKAGGDLGGDVRSGRVQIVHPSGRDSVDIFQASNGTRQTETGSRYMLRVGKKAAGRRLDGVEHNGMPETCAQ